MQNRFLIPAMYLLFINFSLRAQNIECGTIPLIYNDPVFTTAVPVSFGDSMITFNITNNHPSQGFAYPLAKLVPFTPLPAGMTPGNNNNPWSVFASSWNPGVTMPVYYYYDVALPIPPDFTVTFQLWVSNLTPVIADSCYFDDTFSINLNPASLGINTTLNESEWKIVTNSSQHSIEISWRKQLQKSITISLLTNSGSKIFETHAGAGETKKIINTRKFSSGIYLISIEGENTNKVVKKIIL